MFIVIILCLLFLRHGILVMLFLMRFSFSRKLTAIFTSLLLSGCIKLYSFLRAFQAIIDETKCVQNDIHRNSYHKQFKWISNPYNSCSNWYSCIGIVVYIFHFNSNFTTSIDDVPHIQWNVLCELSKESEKTQQNQTIAAALAYSISCVPYNIQMRNKNIARLCVFCIFG